MNPTSYNPSTPPDPKAWRSTDGHERARLIKNYLLTLKPPVRNAKHYAYLVLAAENLIANGYGPARRAVERLQAQGLSRFEAIEAVVSTLVANPTDGLGGDSHLSAQEKQCALNAALDNLSTSHLVAPEDPPQPA